MPLYSRNLPDLVRMPNGTKRHPTRWIVERLSGPQAGTIATFTNEAHARTEALYLHDFEDCCASIVPPAYGDDAS